MPDTLPIGIAPAGGRPRTGPCAPDAGTTQLLDEFNQAYSKLLRLLRDAWGRDDAGEAEGPLFEAIPPMSALQDPAQQLMARPLPGGGGNYGPEFLHVTPRRVRASRTRPGRASEKGTGSAPRVVRGRAPRRVRG
ncbi:hypothetical protein R6L23_01605 [Streptomyces sp. SR27]|uniref:hypothetical protein n=1 Tax=Streptomyces sp. SR27 TaxID=3076630 RepID=UPI00295B9C1A|nr:hypothetical protein [Streptomyces sp. SR27]MDV9186931.1 hypothetical protein [Streptomyces sp. SR27]